MEVDADAAAVRPEDKCREVSRGAYQLPASSRLPLPRHQTLVAHAAASQPEGLDDVGANLAAGGGPSAATACSSRLA